MNTKAYNIYFHSLSATIRTHYPRLTDLLFLVSSRCFSRCHVVKKNSPRNTFFRSTAILARYHRCHKTSACFAVYFDERNRKTKPTTRNETIGCQLTKQPTIDHSWKEANRNHKTTTTLPL